MLVHPDDGRFELVGGLGRSIRGGNDVAARAVHFVREGHCHRLPRDSLLQVSAGGHNSLDPRRSPRRQHAYVLRPRDRPRCDLPRETAEALVRPVDPLHRQPQRLGGVGGHVQRHRIEMLEQARPAVPGHALAPSADIVAAEPGHWDGRPVGDADLVREDAIVRRDRIERDLVEIDQVHLGHRDDEVPDADQLREVGVPPSLGEHALARIDQQDREVRRRRARDHVARVLLVSRSIGDNELALLAGEEAIGDVDGDALLALGGEPVDQQREVDALALRPMLPAVSLQRRKLVVENLLGVVEQPADQRRLPIVHAAARDEAQKLLPLLLREPFRDVGGGVQK